MRRLLAALVLLLAAAAPASAQSSGHSDVCVTAVAIPPVAARFSGMSLTTATGAAGGKGIYVNTSQLGTANNTVGLRITTSAVLDADLVTITPTAIFGVGTIETIIRRGTSPTGAVEGDYVGVVTQAFNFGVLYVPPGRTITFLHTTANTTTSIMVCFVEPD